MFVANRKSYDYQRHQERKKMEGTQALMFIRDVKRNFKRGVSVEATANDMMDDHGKIFKSSLVEKELNQLPTVLIPNNPSDHLEASYLKMSKAERMDEYQNIAQKLKFLETIDMNEDILANQFIADVQVAMDAKAKAQEADEAQKRKRQRLGSSFWNLEIPTAPAPAPAPAPVSSSIFNYFRPRSNSSPR